MTRLNEDDVRTVCEFIVRWWPDYEDALSWDYDMNLDDYEWGRAAKRLLEGEDE